MPRAASDPRCRARKHDYGATPGPGARCSRCGKEWQPPFSKSRAPAAPPSPAPPSSPSAGTGRAPVNGTGATAAPQAAGSAVASEADAAALAAALGAAAPITPEVVAPGTVPAAPDPEGDAAALSFWSSVAPRVITGYVAILETIMERSGREPGEPDETDVQKAGDALTLLCMRWFGPVQLGPGKQLIVSAAFIGGQMWATGKKIEKPAGADDAEKQTKPTS